MFKALMRGLHSRIDRCERERIKQKKLCRETTYQEARVATRRAAGKLARMKALAEMPLPGEKKPKRSRKAAKRK